MELLHTTAREQDGWTVVTASGQVDVATAPQLRQALVEAQYGGARRVVVDLDAVEFMDSMGLGVLVGALKRARTHEGSDLVLACATPRLRHLLEITRLDEIVRVVDRVDAALLGAPGSRPDGAL